jgi:hypothetical protein
MCLFACESLHNTIQYDNRVFKSTQIISLNRAERTTADLSWYHAIKTGYKLLTLVTRHMVQKTEEDRQRSGRNQTTTNPKMIVT